MIANYYTLRALAREWAADLPGFYVGDVYSVERDVLTLGLGYRQDEWTIRVSVEAPRPYVYRAAGFSRPRRNVVTLFDDAIDRRVEGVRHAERDRWLYLDLAGGYTLSLRLFGPRANVLLVDPSGCVAEAFQADAEWSGQAAPAPRPAPLVETVDAFEARWDARRATLEQAVAAALPLFDRTLAAEAIHRAALGGARPADLAAADRQRLFDAVHDLAAALETPAPRIYWRGRFADVLALAPLHHREAERAEAFDSVDAALRVFVRRRLAERRFRERYEPLERALAAAAARYETATERMLDELSAASRADRYEHRGHLLMAAAHAVPPAAERVTLPDLFGDGAPVEIPLDPSLSAVENAQRYYERARRTRQARAHAEQRLVETEAKAADAARLLARLREIDTLPALDAFRRDEADALGHLGGAEASDEARLPFRRFPLDGGYEVWVGRNAAQNDLLTLRYAAKHDLWMHARGVAGSHAVLRLPGRNARPGRDVVERAAAIAAYYSKAQGSRLVPVVVAERKHVRKPKGAAPGAVVVEREQVVLVEPRLPV